MSLYIPCSLYMSVMLDDDFDDDDDESTSLPWVTTAEVARSVCAVNMARSPHMRLEPTTSMMFWPTWIMMLSGWKMP